MKKQKEQKPTIEVAAPKKVPTKTFKAIRTDHGYVEGQDIKVGIEGEKDLRNKQIIK